MQKYPLYKLCQNVSRRFDFKNHEDVIFINTGDVQENKFLHNTLTHKNELPGQAKKAIENGDILFSEIRPKNSRHKLISEENVSNYVVSTKFMVLKANNELITPEFLYILITSKNVVEYFQLIAESRSGTFPQITFEAISNYEVSIPNKVQQNIISEYINNYNRKIELNTQTNQTLEQIAKGIFKHWFIDFAPVHAKANALARGETIEQAELAAMACLSGKTAEKITALKTQDPTAYHQLQQTAAAFPSEFVETEMGQVPKGWEICSITDKRVCSIIKPKIHHFSGEKDYIATANVSQNTIVGELEKITFDNRPSRANMQPIVDSIWFAKMVGEHKAIMIDKNDEFLLKNTILSTGFLGIKPQQYKKCFLYCFINSENFTLLKNSLATGAVQIALNNTSFSSMNIILPSDNVLEYFENKVSKLFSKIATNHRENKSLAETRDLLLPKLLNGEIEL
ncbi:restriction endonuclease subunit S [Gallibacterium anatis]|uniref:restriction endonuclease subunit S n=1 Tax=Gallibacterium anatis TaxID=750 RepID=UPI0039FBA8D5